MASIFTRIIDGELPGRFVWSDPTAVAMVDIRPLHRGHVLVIPRDEVDHWVDLSPASASHLMTVAQQIAKVQQQLFSPQRVGLMIAGFEVPHTHLHVIPINSMADLDFANADTSVRADELDSVRDSLRAGLRDAGHGEFVPD